MAGAASGATADAMQLALDSVPAEERAAASGAEASAAAAPGAAGADSAGGPTADESIVIINNVRGLPSLKADAVSASDAAPSQVISMQFNVIVRFLNGKRLEISVIPTFQVLDLLSLIEFCSNTSSKGYGYMHGGRPLRNDGEFRTVGITQFAQIHQLASRCDGGVLL